MGQKDLDTKATVEGILQKHLPGLQKPRAPTGEAHKNTTIRKQIGVTLRKHNICNFTKHRAPILTNNVQAN